MTDTAADLLAAIDAHLDARLGPYRDHLKACDISIAELSIELRKVNDRLAALEPKPVPEPPPTSLPRLSMIDGVLCEDGQAFRDWSVSMTSWSIFASSDDKLRQFLDDLQELGCRVIRVLHWYGFEGEPIDHYREERLAGMDRLFLEWVHKRKGHIWFCPFHRQCYTGPQETRYGTIKVWSTLQQNRGSGIIPTEIHDTFLWDDALEKIVRANQDTLLLRVNPLTGRKWADEIGVLELANEKLSGKGYIGDASNLSRDLPLVDADGRDGAFLRRMHRFRDATRRQDQNKFTLPECYEMLAWNGYTVYGRLAASARDVGYRGPVITSSFHGDATMACLPEQMAGDLVGLHIYRSSIKALPDPFDAAAVRNVHTITNAIRCLPVAIGEINAAVESAGPTERFLEAPGYVAGCGADLVSWYAAAQATLDSPTPDSEIYNLWIKRPDWVKQFALAAPLFHARKPLVEPKIQQLSYEDVFGVKGVKPPVPGTQPWAGFVGGVRLPEIGWLKK